MATNANSILGSVGKSGSEPAEGPIPYDLIKGGKVQAQSRRVEQLKLMYGGGMAVFGGDGLKCGVAATLCFLDDKKGELKGLLSIQNSSEQSMAYRLSTTSAYRFKLDSAYGVLQPKSLAEVVVRTDPRKFNGRNRLSQDGILVECSAITSPKTNSKTLFAFWKTLQPSMIEEHYVTKLYALNGTATMTQTKEKEGFSTDGTKLPLVRRRSEHETQRPKVVNSVVCSQRQPLEKRSLSPWNVTPVRCLAAFAFFGLSYIYLGGLLCYKAYYSPK